MIRMEYSTAWSREHVLSLYISPMVSLYMGLMVWVYPD